MEVVGVSDLVSDTAASDDFTDTEFDVFVLFVGDDGGFTGVDGGKSCGGVKTFCTKAERPA